MTEKEPKVWYSLSDIFLEGILREETPTRARSRHSLSYDSPLESKFVWGLLGYLHPDVELESQVPIDTICGRFRLDFVARHGNRRVAFECDGKEYHDERRDEWRDAMILGAEAVDVIYHFRGRDLTYYINDCLFLASQWEPDIFSSNGYLQLKELASEKALDYVERCSGDDHTFHQITYGMHPELDYREPMHIFVVRNSVHVAPGVNPFWKGLFQFEQKRYAGNLDDLIEQWFKPI